MISNLLSAIRDDKSVQLADGASTEGSGDNKESKAGFGLIFQTLQGKESKEQGKNQPPSDGQTELAGEDLSAGEAETGNVKTESAKKETVVQPNTNSVSKAFINKTETAQKAQTEAAQTEVGQEKVVDQKLTLQIAEADLQERSDETAVQTGEKKEDGNAGKAPVTIQGNPDISTTDGLPKSEMQDANGTDNEANGDEKSTGNKNEPARNQEAVKVQVNTNGESVIPKEDIAKEHPLVTGNGKNVNTQEIAEISKVEQDQESVTETKNAENTKNLADAKQKIIVNTRQGSSETEPTTGEQKTVSAGQADRTGILQAETQNEEKAVSGEDKPTQLNDKTQTSSEIRVNSSTEVASPGSQTEPSGTGKLKTDGLTKPVSGAAENEIQNVKAETSSKESVSIQSADKNGPETQGRAEISINQEEERIAGALKINKIKGMAFKGVERHKLLNATQASETRAPVSEENQEKLIHNTLINKEAAYPLENGMVLKKLYADDIREKKYGDRLYHFESREENTAEREKIPVDGRNSQQWSGQTGSFSNGQFQMGETSSSSELKMNEDELSWKNHTVDVTQPKENKAAEQQSTGFSKLMEIPVFNASVRRNLMPALTQTVLKTGSGNGTSTENWQKHNFTLENGKNLQLSMRQADGVVYMKLNSTHSELTRLLVQHQDEIRQHLQKECNLEIDLQFEDNGEQDLSQFFDDSSSGKRGWRGKPTMTSGKAFVERESQDVQTTIRKFGYNRMEWMA